MADAGYGDTHSGKSKAIEMLAGYLFERSGKKTRVYIGDGGGETYNSRGLVDDGVIELLDFSVYDYPQTVLKLMSDFYWLKDPKDPKSKLVAPPANLSEQYGMMVYEGGTVIGNWLLSDVPGGFAWHAAQATGFGGIKDADELLTFTDKFKGAEGIDSYQDQGINAPLHYAFSQKKILNAIRKTKQFPGMVFWTFHPVEGPDKTSGGESGDMKSGFKVKGKAIIGPDAGGRALASTIGKEFGNLLHFDQALVLEKEQDETTKKQITDYRREFRIYTRRHYDPNQDVMIEYVAGTRSAGVKDYYTSKEPGDSLLQFYQAVKENREKERLKKGTVSV
jgi:hypothetical protein